MSKRKICLRQPDKIFTPEEVLQEVKEYEEKYANSSPRRTVGKKAVVWWKEHRGEYFGFEYNYQFLKLECGWIEGHEMICEYCVQSLVNYYGTEAERIAFNKVNDLGERYTCWITNKDYSKMRKKAILRKRQNRRDLQRYYRDERRGIKPVFVEV